MPDLNSCLPTSLNSGWRMALVVDPRFSGGTCSAVAAEIRALDPYVDLTVHALETKMFKGRRVNPKLNTALDDCGLELIWDAPVIRADTVVIHNPSCLKFNQELNTRISCDTAVIVTHENFLRPNGSEAFDIESCLELIDGSLICRSRMLAPVSAYNRSGVEGWLRDTRQDWTTSEFDWFNICDFELIEPNPAPRDRRGRHSRAGYEKFPSLTDMEKHFPSGAQTCSILGGDSFLTEADTIPSHWDIKRFGEVSVSEFLSGIDFFVYFTNPMWRESFGRVIPEAIAAGKLVITDTGTAQVFGDAVVTSDGTNVDEIISGFIADPAKYTAFIRAAQKKLNRFRPEVFTQQVLSGLGKVRGSAHAVV